MGKKAKKNINKGKVDVFKQESNVKIEENELEEKKADVQLG